MARVRIVVRMQKMHMVLKRPILSPMMPGRVRPKMEPALRMLTRYSARVSDMPWEAASATMKAKGMNIPQ